MSQSSHEDRSQTSDSTQEATNRQQTMQMNPAILGQAANMNPASDVLNQLDSAAKLLEHASDEAAVGEAKGDDASSIEQYMSALLARSRGAAAVAGPTQVMSPGVKTASVPSSDKTADDSAATAAPSQSMSRRARGNMWPLRNARRRFPSCGNWPTSALGRRSACSVAGS